MKVVFQLGSFLKKTDSLTALSTPPSSMLTAWTFDSSGQKQHLDGISAYKPCQPIGWHGLYAEMPSKCCFWPELSKVQAVSMEDGGVDRAVRLSVFFRKLPSWKTTFINAYLENAFIHCGLVQLQSSVRWSKTSLIVISRKDRPSETSKANNILEFRSYDWWIWQNYCQNASTTPLRQWGFRQCLPKM